MPSELASSIGLRHYGITFKSTTSTTSSFHGSQDLYCREDNIQEARLILDMLLKEADEVLAFAMKEKHQGPSFLIVCVCVRVYQAQVKIPGVVLAFVWALFNLTRTRKIY